MWFCQYFLGVTYVENAGVILTSLLTYAVDLFNYKRIRTAGMMEGSVFLFSEETIA